MNDLYRRQRRQWLRLLASGALGAAGASGVISRALAKGDVPPTQGVHQLEGTARVNGRDARVGTPVNLGDRISTGSGSQAVIVLGADAFLLRANTALEVKGREGTLTDLAIATGKVLSVFSKKPVAIKAASASIGIRGTGAYFEIDPDGAYFCLCYGEAQVQGPGMSIQEVKTTHHERPLLLRMQGQELRSEPGAFRNHTDAELVLLESLVGREPPFMKDGTYPANKY